MIDVVSLWAVSYSGATWVSLVLGSRPEVMAIGNLSRALERLESDPGEVCRIHRGACPLWPAFAERWDPGGDFFAQLAEFTGKEAFVVRNPGRKVAAHLAGPSIRERHLVLARDARALTASYMRKNPGTDVMAALDDWVIDAVRINAGYLKKPDATVIRHERASVDVDYLYERLGAATGRAYGPEQGRFWEHDHHIAAGNAGTMRTVIAYQQEEAHRQDFYDRFMEDTVRKGGTTFVDERWKRELDRFDLYAIERCLAPFGEAGVGEGGTDLSDAERRELARRFEERLRERPFVNEIPGSAGGRLSTRLRHLARRLLSRRGAA